MDREKDYKISKIGEFSDRNLEQAFFQDYIARNMKYIRPVVLMFGIIYMLFIIPDYFFAKDRAAFLIILENRIAFFVLIMLLFAFVNKFKNFKRLSLWITAFEILASISFLIIFVQYKSPDLLIQAFGVIIMILTMFIVPNKWINMLIASVFVSIAFFVVSKYYFTDVPVSEYSAGIVYILIVLVLSALESFRSNYYNRKQYIYLKELLELSTIDWLTGIANRTKFDTELERWLAYTKRYEEPLSLILLDIDDFKNINDVFGHLAGDKVLIEISRIIQSEIRENDVFARWGGDEFMLLLPSTDEEQALNLIDRLRLLVAGYQFEKVGKVACSFGLAMATPNDGADDLVNRTDQLLYTAKMKGKNTVAAGQDIKPFKS